MRVGDQVRVTRTCMGCDERAKQISYYDAGCLGWLIEQVAHGWMVDFEHPANRASQFKLNRLTGDAVWFVSTKDIEERSRV